MSTPRSTRSRTRGTTVLGVVAGLAGLGLANPIGAAAATPDTPQVVNRESVDAKLDPTGRLDVARVYSQLTVLGNGRVTLQDPTSTKGLRDLDGFSRPVVRDGKAQYTLDVNGRKDLRTVADFTGALPVTLKPSYTLNGKPVRPADVAGKSGLLEVTYTVVNQTSKPTQITYKNGKGEDVTETVDVVTPYVGSLAIDLPQGFRNVQAPGSDGGGDGRGGTSVSWSLALFNPLGEVAQQLKWKAQVTDAQLPPATLQVVPVTADGNQILPSGKQTLQDGADGAAALTAGAYKIDASVLQLRDGAFKILDGLVKLSDGARALNAGLAGSAAPGSQQLADGLGQAQAGGQKLGDGLGQLNDGGKQLAGGLASAKEGSGKLAAGLGSASAGGQKLAAGSQDLATGAGKAADGAKALSAGLAQISAGLQQLSGTSALPAAQAGAVRLREAIDRLLAGLGDAGTSGTILNGVARVSGGLGQLKTGIGAAKVGVDTIKAGVDDGLKSGGGLDQLAGGVTAAQEQVAILQQACATATNVLACQTAAGTAAYALGKVADGINGTDGLRARSQAASAGLGQVSTGLGGAVAGIGDQTTSDTLLNGMARISDGLGQIVQGLKSGDKAAPGVAEGLDSLVTGLTAAVTGVSQLSTGAGSASTGSQALAAGTSAVAAGAGKLSSEGAVPLSSGLGQLAAGGQALDSGLGQLQAGGSKLSAGLGSAADGSTQLNGGLTKLADGATKLAAGLTTAADGSGKLADGVDQVKNGVQQVGDGTTELSGRGTSLLAGSANNAATDTAKKVAVLAALQDRAKNGALPYGAPQGAVGDAAFSYTLAGATTDVQGNTTRGAIALVVLALGSLSGFVLRRRVTA